MKVFGILGAATGIVSAESSTERSGCLHRFWAHFSPDGYGVVENDSMSRDDGYDFNDSCEWSIQSGFNSDKRLMIRLLRFDLEDSKFCDQNENNDHRGPPSVFELRFQDDNGDWETEKFCHTLGEDRFAHKMQRSGINRNFRSGNPRNFKHKKGENLLSWTQLDVKEVRFELAIGKGANENKWYKGFRAEYAIVSDMTHDELRAEIDEFISDNENYAQTMRSGQQRAIKKFIQSKMKKANKQNGVRCVAEITNVPEFVQDAWKKVTTMSDLVSFLNGENRKEGDAFQGYFNFVHGGCWRKIDSLENMDKWHSRFRQWMD